MKHYTSNEAHMLSRRGRKIVETFEKKEPMTLQAVRKLGFKMNKISTGAFRDVYKFRGTRLILKIPGSVFEVHHSHIEMKWYTKIMTCKKYKELRPYMPDIYYYNPDSGIILVKEYKLMFPSGNWNRVVAVGMTISHLMDIVMHSTAWGSRDLDNSGNLAYDEEGQLKIIDMGCFSGYDYL